MQRVRYASLAAILVLLAACQSDQSSGPIDNTPTATSDVNVNADCGDCVFLPTIFTRGSGPPVVETASFTANPAGTFILELDDLGTGVKAKVTLNGVQLSTGKVGGGSGKAFFNVTLLAINDLEIELKGTPGVGQLQVKVRELRCAISPQTATIALGGVEERLVNGVKFKFYTLNVTTNPFFADFQFQHWPGLPPCGINTNESRTWVDIYAFFGTGPFFRVYGFCALETAAALNQIAFPIRSDLPQPKNVYITVNDRACVVVSTSNTIVIP